MSVYYNEWEPHAAQWLRNLIAAGHLPAGDVDERDIREVKANEIRGYTQHHFFAGIGGWALAARLAGVDESARIVTGSPPCQPFSQAGRQRGIEDDRHLAPAWLELVKAIRPSFVFGEQVAAAINKDAWLDVLLNEFEGEDYSTGAIVLPACSQGAPHIRQRVWFAGRLGDPKLKGLERLAWNGDTGGRQEQVGSIAETGFWDQTDWLPCRDGKWRSVESGTFPLADGIPARVGRLRAYGNAIVPQVAAEVIREAMK